MPKELSVSLKTLKNRRKKRERKLRKLLRNKSLQSNSKKIVGQTGVELEENIFAHYDSKNGTSKLREITQFTSILGVSDSLSLSDSIQNSSCDSQVTNLSGKVYDKRQHRIHKPNSSQIDYNVIKKQRRNLPVFSVRRELLSIFAEEDVVVLKGETACGKTTQIPQFLLEGGLVQDKAVAVTQPRRVAAITIAERVAQEVGTILGKKVGYCVRFEDVTSMETKIKYVTDGMLLRESISDPLLSSYSWIILDEAHERTIHTDVLFGIVKSAQCTRRNENMFPLKIIIMSATIDEEKIVKYFNNAPVYNLPSREYSITIYNSQTPKEDYVSSALSTVFQIHRMEAEGDILVFLTGEEEIESMVSQTRKISSELEGVGYKLFPCPLYAALPSHLQCAVLKPPSQGIRKM